jgi:diadenosine tetraphosphate (Ap4A) HIT family hydrolase
MASCLICRKLSGEVAVAGGFVYEDDVVAAFHAASVERPEEPVYLGQLLVVTKRHAPRLGDLTDDEAAAVGVAATRLARSLVEQGGADWVYSAVIGTRVPHFHVQLLPRYADTPRDLPWYHVDEWEGARRGAPRRSRRSSSSCVRRMAP